MFKRISISVFVLTAALLLGSGCGRTADLGESISQVAAGQELIATVETRDEAEALAEQYGIELVSYSNGVAVFHTEEDPEDVIARGVDKGWTPLSLNMNNQLS